MQNHFEINVALNGRHLFATAPRSVVTKQDALFLVYELRVRFPATEGFSISCTYWEGIGTPCGF